MKIYISGPITGHDKQEVSRAFAEAKRLIIDAGHTPVNPLENGLPETATYEMHLLKDFQMMLECDAIILLYGWSRSKGCRMENYIAVNMGLTVITSFAGLKRIRVNSNCEGIGWC